MVQAKRLQQFVDKVTALVDAGTEEPRLLPAAREAMQELIASDDWLPEEMTRPHPLYYQQYAGDEVILKPGDVELVSPAIGDIHTVSNAYDDRVSISIHAYGANIGKVRRHVFDPHTGATKDFVSGYANA